MWFCMEMDHQPQYKKFHDIGTLKHHDPNNILEEELKKCKPLFRVCHRIISKYRMEVDKNYQVGDKLPDEWIAKWSEKNKI